MAEKVERARLVSGTEPPADSVEAARDVSLRRRLLSPRTIGSLIFGIVLLYLVFRFFLGEDFDFGQTIALIGRADLGFLALAFLAYYLTFPLRGFRWQFVLARSGVQISLRDSTEMLFLSWFVNCLVPAKLGDLYRAYLLRGNYGASISRTVGTIFIERIADIVVIAALALAAGFWSFRGRSRPEIDTLFLLGFGVAAILVIGVLALRFWGHQLARFMPGRLADLYERFHHGSTGAIEPRSVPVLLAVTSAIWILEGFRLYFVIRALGLPEVGLGISASVFVTLIGSLLTAIPLTPAGVGFVEAGIIGALSVYGVAQEPAAAVALTDRAISIVTVILLGGILYAVSRKVRRAHLS